jgi:hypothetical protein
MTIKAITIASVDSTANSIELLVPTSLPSTTICTLVTITTATTVTVTAAFTAINNYLLQDTVCALGMPGPLASAAALSQLPANYLKAYRRVVSVLGDFGCSPLEEGSVGRAAPADADICLSVLDPLIATGNTKTRFLNAVSNRYVQNHYCLNA